MDGIIVVNKPKGYTSHDVVAKLRKILKIKKIGHTGTLDPNATGVLPLLIGKGTLLSSLLIEHDKIYKATIKLGKETDTLDGEGKVITEENIPKKALEKENVKNILQCFLGINQQIPPMYSAIKVNGKKLYEYARSGQEVELKPRQIEIYSIELNEIKYDEITFTVHCSKGTYIRSLCADIAKKLGTVGYMKELERLKVGRFNIENSYTIEELEEKIENKIITIEEFFYDKEIIKLSNKKIELFLNGVQLKYNLKNELYKIYSETDDFIGIGEIKDNNLKRKIVVCT